MCMLDSILFNRVTTNGSTFDELRAFFEIILATGLVVLPNFADYWKSDSILSQPGIVKGMSQNQFEQLCGWLHFNDNSLAPVHRIPGYDRLYKIRPVLHSICEKSLWLYNPGNKLIVVEAMVNSKADHQSNSTNL